MAGTQALRTGWLRTAAVIGVLLSPALAPAHPGHGAPGDGWRALHFLTEPLHGAGVAIAALGLLLALRRRRRS